MSLNFTKQFLISIFVCHAALFYGQSFPAKEISTAFVNMDANALSYYFNDQLDIILLNKQYDCTSTQAKYILEKFFIENPISELKVLHRGLNHLSTYLVINYETKSECFKIYLLLKNLNSTFKVFQFRIENDKSKK